MKDKYLTHQRLFGQTPQDISLRIEHTLNILKEDKPMKKGISGVLIIAIVLLLLCAAAVAAVQGGGLDWFYKHIWHIPTLPDDAYEDIQNDLPQNANHPLLNLIVESAVWLPKEYDMNYPEERTLEILVSATPKDPSKYEVHPWQNLNGDGYRDDRKVDYLETKKGVSPIGEAMTDPKKALLLYGSQREDLLGMPHSLGVEFPISFYWDTYDDAGNILRYISFHISDSLVDRMSKYANRNSLISLLYADYSWLWNAQGDTAGHTQYGTVSFQIMLPK